MIRVLDKKTADKIAAGEVIDRPVSIVKELVENSLDAGASDITVVMEDGGITRLRITDNGSGIPPEDTERAFLRHATSKISAEDDLDAIMTLGFRGEALASICAVSRLEMITKTHDEKTGRRVIAEDSRIIRNDPTGCPEGTTITVSDLFYNVPARRKFLGTPGAEARRITDLMSRIALAYPDVRIRLMNGRREVFQTTGRGNILDTIIRVYGRDMAKDLVPVDTESDGMILRGFISSPGVTSSSSNRQFFCVNGRVISSKVMQAGLERAYRERMFPGRHPIAFLFLSVPPDQVDVNVHPAKKEVRFNDDHKVEDLIAESAAKSLSGKSAVPGPGTAGHALSEPSETDENPEKPGFPEEKPVSENVQSSSPFRNAEKAGTKDFGEQVDIKNILQTMREEKESYAAGSGSADSGADVRQGEAGSSGSGSDNRSPLQENPKSSVDIASLDILGAVLRTYIVAEDGDSMYLIDQHAAHERVFYERLLKEYHSDEKYSQSTVIPLQISVSARTQQAEENWLPHVQKMGYDIEYFGNNTYLIRGLPAFMDPAAAESFLRSFLLETDEFRNIREFAQLERLIMRSCKSAVKGGDSLKPEEIRELLRQLAACDRPWSCPHGRPTIIRLTEYDLEKMFRRA